ncbi:MAG: TRAM domain-containing protein, partial [Planctomycetota bacterium]
GRTFDVYVEGLSRAEQKRSGKTKGDIRKASAITLTIGGRDPSATAVAEPEAPATTGPVQMSGRTDGDLIVLFDTDTPDDLVGRIVPVRITNADRLSLFGQRLNN